MSLSYDADLFRERRVYFYYCQDCLMESVESWQSEADMPAKCEACGNEDIQTRSDYVG